MMVAAASAWLEVEAVAAAAAVHLDCQGSILLLQILAVAAAGQVGRRDFHDSQSEEAEAVVDQLDHLETESFLQAQKVAWKVAC